MYWTFDGTETKTLIIPWLSTGEDFSFSADLVIEDGETFECAYLCLLSIQFVGMVQMRVSPATDYIDVMHVMNSRAWLGTLTGPRTLSIDFLLSFSDDFATGEYAIPIGVFHGPIPGNPPNTFFAADETDYPLWGQEEADSPLWNALSGSPPYWVSGSMCARAEYQYISAGETMVTGQVVYAVRESGQHVAYLASATGAQAEGVPFGIVADNTVYSGKRKIQTAGFVTNASWSLTTGKNQYLGATAGAFTETRPQVGFASIVGQAVSATTLCIAQRTPKYNLSLWAGSCVAYDGARYMYQFGGNDGTGVCNRLRRLDLFTLQWTELTAGCTARTNAGMTFSAGVLYIVGGKDAAGHYLTTMCTYNTITHAWSVSETGLTGGSDQTVIADAWPNDGQWVGEWTEDWVYNPGDVVVADGILYQSATTNTATATNRPGTGATGQQNWVVIPQITTTPPVATPWVAGGTFAQNQVVIQNGVNYVALAQNVGTTTTQPGIGTAWQSTWAAVQTWQAGAAFTTGTVVQNNGVYYVATVDNTADADTEPGIGVDWQTVWQILPKAPAWQSGVTYAQNAIVGNNGTFYVATIGNTSGASTQPGVGASWQTVWTQINDWQSGQSVDAGQIVLDAGVFYVALSPHTTGATTQPGIGANWRSTWAIVPTAQAWRPGQAYPADFVTEHNGVFYISKSAHTADADSEPGVGADWATYWTAINGFALWASGATVSADDIYTQDGKFYRAKQGHTTGSTTQPGIGADWHDYWELLQTSTDWIPDLEVEIGDVLYVNGIAFVASQAHTTSADSKPMYGADWANYWTVATQQTPSIFVVSGTTSGGIVGTVSILNTTTGAWTSGVASPQGFIDDMNVAGGDNLANATLDAMAISAIEANQVVCSHGANLALVGTKVYSIGREAVSHNGEYYTFQYFLVSYDLPTDTWETRLDLSGDYATGQTGYMDNPGLFQKVIGYNGILYGFGQYHRVYDDVECYGCFRINPATGEMQHVASIRAGELQYMDMQQNDRDGCGIIYCNGKAYIYGGHGDVATKLDIFDFSTLTFTVGTVNIGDERRYFVGTAYEGTLYLGGGEPNWSDNTIDLLTNEYGDWDTSAVSWPISTNFCNADNGAMFVFSDPGLSSFAPSTNAWAYNDSLVLPYSLIGPLYYGGAIYYCTCTDGNPQMFKITIPSSTEPVPFLLTSVSIVNGLPVVTFTTTTSSGSVVSTWNCTLTLSGSSSSGSLGGGSSGASNTWNNRPPLQYGNIQDSTFAQRGKIYGRDAIVTTVLRRNANGSLSVVKAEGIFI